MVRDWSLALVAARPRTVIGDENVLLESDMAKARWYFAWRGGLEERIAPRDAEMDWCENGGCALLLSRAQQCCTIES